MSAANDPRYSELAEVIQHEMARHHVPGVAVGILDGDAEYLAGFGVTNQDHPLPVDGDTLFQVGSTTKTITATLVMQLVEVGLLDLDAPIRTYLPDLRLSDADATERVSMRHLLTHSGGWEGDFFIETGRGDDALARYVERVSELPQMYPLGEAFCYNNAGFAIAGRVVEVVTGQPYETVARERVLVPLGMAASCFFPEEALLRGFVVGHRVNGDQVTLAVPWNLPRNANAMGGLASSARDQLRYARFHNENTLGVDGSVILSSASLSAMQTPQLAIDANRQMALPWFVRDVGDVRLVYHGGATNGQMSAFILAPARRFAVTVLTNASNGNDLHEAVTNWVLARFLGAVIPEPTARPSTPEDWAPLLGRYENYATAIDLLLEDGQPRARISDKITLPGAPAEPPITLPLELLTDGNFRVTSELMHGRVGQFVRDDAGEIVWLRVGVRLYRRIEGAI